MILRVLLLGVLIMALYAAITVYSRKQGPSSLRVPHGITLIEGDTCSKCVVAKARFDALGIAYQAIDVASAAALGLTTMAVPTVYVGSDDGAVTMVRRGAAVVADIEEIAAAARMVA